MRSGVRLRERWIKIVALQQDGLPPLDKDPARLTEFPALEKRQPGGGILQGLLFSGTVGFGSEDDVEDEANEIDSLEENLQLQPADEGISKELWISDHNSPNCYDCGKRFTAFRRRHHCRLCGQVFCGKCSSKTIKSSLSKVPLRCCNLCFADLETLSDEFNPENVDVGDRDNAVHQPHEETTAHHKISEVTPQEEEEEGEGHHLLNLVRPQIESASLQTAHDLEQRGEDRGMKALYQKQLEAIVWNLLVQNQIVENTIVWKDKIVQYAQEAAKKLKVSCSPDGTDKMDIRYYAKVKSVENGSISQCAYIDGVVFRKNVVNKKMPSVIPKARILLFGCSLEFQRTNRMTSFDLAVFQEQEYLSILVSKILTLKPDIIVSRFGVSRIMQEHFVAAGIVLLINVKASTMARLARSTNATILTSAEHVDYLSFSKVLGYCSTFRLERMVSIGGKTKGCTYSIFESSSPERHCTIYLRGADKATLRRLKTCTRAAIHAASNLNIELTLLWSLSCSYRYEDIETELKELHESLSSLEAMDSKLSMSPSLSFSKKRSESDAIKLFEILSDVTPPPISVLSSLDADSRSTDFEFMDSTPSIIDEIVFVECCLVSNSNRLCSVPALRRIKFYSESDVTLKQFLSMVCFNQKWKCTSECKAQKLFKHVISIFHGNGRIQIRVRKLKRPLRQVPDGKMLMWNYCNGCTKIVTPLLVVSEKVGSYSFGKFLETWMYNDKALCKSETCGHRVFRDQEIFFSSNEFVVRFEYSPIFPFSILFASSVPHSMQEILALQSRSPVFGRLGNLEVAKLELQAIRFVSNHMFSSFQMYVSDCVSRLGSVESDEIISKLKSIRDLVNNYRKKFVDSLEDIENEFLSGPEDALLVGQGSLVVLILNGLKAELVSCGIEWNDRLVALKRLEQTIRRQSESKDGSTGSAESMSQAEHSQPMTHSSMEVSPKITEDFKSISPIVLKDITVESEPAAPVPSDPRFLSSWLDPDNGSHFYLHPFLTGCSILVIEDEPSSVVAAALMSLEHVARLNLIAAKQFREHTPAEQLSLCSVIVPENLIELNQESRFKSSVSSEISVNVILNHDADPEHVHTSLSDLNEDKSPEHFDIVADKATEAGELLAGSSSVSFEPIDQELLNQLLSPDVEPFIHKFMLSQNGITTWFECVSYFPVQFNALRRAYLSSDVDFICSISRCMKWSASGGRSGSGFAKTLDDRFILKYVKRREFKMYLQYALQYFQYIGKSMFQRCPSLLVKILGVYQVSWSKSNGNRMSTKHIVIMPNLFYGTDVKAVFDLKGNMRNRFVNTEEPGVPENAVLLDENFLRYTKGMPLPLTSRSKEYLRLAVHNDTLFLSKQDIVDYSILLGMNEKTKTVVLGIIDYLHQYTWDKQIETGVKSLGKIAGQGTPTVVSPSSYKTRFREAMERYFMAAPSRFTTLKP